MCLLLLMWEKYCCWSMERREEQSDDSEQILEYLFGKLSWIRESWSIATV